MLDAGLSVQRLGRQRFYAPCMSLWSYMWNMLAFVGVSRMSTAWEELSSLLAIVPMQGNKDLNGAASTAALVLDFLHIQEEMNVVRAFPNLSGQPGWELLRALFRAPGTELPKLAEQLSNLTVLFTARLPGTEPN